MRKIGLLPCWGRERERERGRERVDNACSADSKHIHSTSYTRLYMLCLGIDTLIQSLHLVERARRGTKETLQEQPQS